VSRSGRDESRGVVVISKRSRLEAEGVVRVGNGRVLLGKSGNFGFFFFEDGID